MDFTAWLAFALAATVILVIPGPTIILVVTQAVTYGGRSVIPLVAGVLLGDFTAMTCSLLGLGALMSASAALFSLFKWVGAIYLLYLGIRLFPARSHADMPASCPPLKSGRTLFRSSYIVTALNPKSIAFFVAFLPQFIDPVRPVHLQLATLGATFLTLATVNAALYALFAGRLGDHLQRNGVRTWFNRFGGTALIGAGIFTAGLQRSA
jgi:threonine/homoserine/homoserine lactone efflux protein